MARQGSKRPAAPGPEPPARCLRPGPRPRKGSMHNKPQQQTATLGADKQSTWGEIPPIQRAWLVACAPADRKPRPASGCQAAPGKDTQRKGGGAREPSRTPQARRPRRRGRATPARRPPRLLPCCCPAAARLLRGACPPNLRRRQTRQSPQAGRGQARRNGPPPLTAGCARPTCRSLNDPHKEPP